MLQPTPQIDSDHPDIVAFARQHAVGADERERAVALYLAVRDRIRYDPYRIDLSPAGMRASRAWRSTQPERRTMPGRAGHRARI